MSYKRNPEKVHQYNQLNYQNNKVTILASQKQYRETNKEKIVIARAKYNQIHKEEIKAKKKEKMVCECGTIINFASYIKHLKTKKHNLETKIQF